MTRCAAYSGAIRDDTNPHQREGTVYHEYDYATLDDVRQQRELPALPEITALPELPALPEP